VSEPVRTSPVERARCGRPTCSPDRLRESRRRVVIGGIGFDPLTEREVVEHVRRALDRGAGGHIVTPNVDIMRLVRRDPVLRADIAAADLVVPDGMPVVWASRLAGARLPERVAGSSLLWSLGRTLAGDGRSVYLLGGAPPGFGRAEGAHRAAGTLASACPGLRIAGYASPRFGFDSSPGILRAVCREVIAVKPDLVYVGLGFPKQERFISLLRPDLPGAWFLGCGAAIDFAAGDRARAPEWMQRSGLEWVHRMAGEPRRLAGRYLRHDAPYAVSLLARAVLARVS
jgi:N-acetylglucosaminyldiphosphoundecaprenol N-acetyl-beta-D-mannosaminyltransferase